MLHLAVESAFDELLSQWRAHDSCRRNQDLSVAELAASRQQLDLARTRMHKMRATMYPNVSEIESVIESVWCESLETVVHLRWMDRNATRPGTLSCACGHLVPVDWHRLRS